jgi:hypothetical protein
MEKCTLEWNENVGSVLNTNATLTFHLISFHLLGDYHPVFSLPLADSLAHHHHHRHHHLCRLQVRISVDHLHFSLL